jgi:hypothetical protein
MGAEAHRLASVCGWPGTRAFMHDVRPVASFQYQSGPSGQPGEISIRVAEHDQDLLAQMSFLSG